MPRKAKGANPVVFYQPLPNGQATDITLPGYEHRPLRYFHHYQYANNYLKLAKILETDPSLADSYYRQLILTDPFFLTYFHLGIKKANHPFVISRCNEITQQGTTNILDLWARGHFKSTLLTTVIPVQRILANPEERICIFSFRRESAMGFYLPIKELFEKDTMLHRLFPDILTPDLRSYPLWTRDLGITVLRKGFYREPTLMFSGFLEGLPTGKHFTGKIFDDIMTQDMALSPNDMERSKVMFSMAQNLTDNDTGHDRTEWEVIAGTPYHYNDVLKFIEEMKNHDGTPAYQVRRYPATEDGTKNGIPVLLTQTALDRLKRDPTAFASQQLLTPVTDLDRKLSFDLLIRITKEQLPKNLFGFLLIDPAGDKDNQKHKLTKGDNWAITLLGVEPIRDAIGQSNIYILDLILKSMGLTEAMELISSMFFRSPVRIIKIGLEKTGISTYEYHISNQLKKHGRTLTVDNKGIQLLRPGIRNKIERIGTALEIPLHAAKWHYLDTIQPHTINSLKEEMNNFPRGRDDGIDILSYVYDVIFDYKFPERPNLTSSWKKPNDMWLDEEDVSVRSISDHPWMLG